MTLLPLTVGTAGHIDHGKTTLVRALTGRDTDRLPEERRRGMSIELGFADLDLGDRQLSLVDVPGHERFVRTMIAGASGVDMFLLVVAADDGPMPQTREHLTVMRALGVERGVIVLSKTDLAKTETRRLAAEQASTLAPGLPLVEASSLSGDGLEKVRAALTEVAATVETERRRREIETGSEQPVLHIDRVFTVTGHGTVITGTLWSGQFQRGQRVTLLPKNHDVRVRSIHVHGRSLDVADSNQRVALNLVGVARDEVQRGDVVTTLGAGIHVTYRLDVEIFDGAEEILGESRVQVHLGTRDVPARVIYLAEDRAQLRLEQPLLARLDDRVVVRRIAPPYTLGGCRVSDPAPPRHGAGWKSPVEEKKPAASSVGTSDELSPFARHILAALEVDGDQPRGAVQLAKDLAANRRQVDRAFGELVAAGKSVRAKADIVYPASTYRRLGRQIIEIAERDGSTSIAEIRDALSLSRKYAQALLEQLDGERRLRRRGNRHFPRSREAE